MELADLTRGMRKKWIFRAWKNVFCKAGLVWVSWEQCGKKYSLKTCFFLQGQACLNFIRLVCKKKSLIFFQSRASLSFVKKFFPQLQPMLNPALCSQGKERDSEGKLPWRQGSCRIMVRVSDLNFEGRRINTQWWTFPGTALFSELLGHALFQVPKSTHILSLHGLEAFQASAKKNNFSELEKLFFCKARLHPKRPQGVTPHKKWTAKGNYANLTYKQ